MKISEFSVTRPVTVMMVTASILVLGYISLQRLPLTLMPEFESQRLSVRVNYPSSSPDEVEREITRPLEEVLSTLNNLESIESNSSSGSSNIRLEFTSGTNMDLVSLEVRDRVDQVRNLLPTDVERVDLRRFQSTDMPVYRFAIGWTGDPDELYNITEDIMRRRLERIEGVANVEVQGIDTRQILIDLDAQRLQAYGIDVNSISRDLRNSNVNLSAGFVYDGGKKYSLRTVGEFTDVEQIANLPLGGGRFTLKDIADVRYDYPVKDSFSRLNSKDSVSVRVYKASTANVVRVCGDIRRALDEIRDLEQLGGNLSVQTFDDQSEAILKSLSDLKIAGIYGGLLAMVVLFFFLRKFRSTLIISLAIPVSIVFTFAFMYMLRVFAGSGITLNVVTLMGLMVAVGMLVDCSVVVLENIFRYKQEKGLDTISAAIKGSSEVGLAVIASTATTVVVFVGVLFTGQSGFGRFATDFGIAVSVALIASLVVAMTMTPMLAGRLFTGIEKPKAGWMVWLSESYGKSMRGLLRWRFVALILMAGIAWSSYSLFTTIDRELMPSVSERRLGLNVMMERSYSLTEMTQFYNRLETLLLDNKDKLQITSISSNFGNSRLRRGMYRGEIQMFLSDEGATIPAAEIQETIRQMLPEAPGVEYNFGRRHGYGGGGEMGVEVELAGDDPALLAQYAELIQARLATVPGIKDVQTTLDTGDDEIHLSVDRRKVEKFGINPELVARTVSSALSSRAATRYKSDQREVDVVLEFRGGNDITLQQLANTQFENLRGEMIPLSAVVDYSYEKGPLSIERDNKRSVLDVVANTERGGSSFMVSGAVQGALQDLTLPAGYTWSLGRGFRDFRNEEQESFFAILVAVILMYIIMAALFESFIHPLTILFTVPFSLIGVAGLFYLTGTTLNRNAYLGILVLFGIVVNNGIILIDHINKLRKEMSVREAIVQGGMDRLRPILMTAATSLFGLAPLSLPFLFPEIFGPIQGRSRMWAPVSLAVLGGLTTSTFLTLVILPTVYSYMDDLGQLASRAVARLRRLRPAKPLAEKTA